MFGNVGKNVSAANKLWQAQRKIKKIEAVGQANAVSVLINGVYEVDEIEIDSDKLISEFDVDESTAKKLALFFKKDFKKAMDEAKKNLEKQLRGNTNLDDLKNLFS